MPELPDVSVFKQYLDATALHKKIVEAKLNDRDILGDIGPGQLQKRLCGRKLVSSRQHGKYLFVETDGAGWLLLHFGMTGFLKYFATEEDPPAHARLLLHFDNDHTLAYVCQRKLGKVDLIDEPDAFIAEKALGPDPLNSAFGLSEFRKAVSERSGSVKSFLMNQEVMAGIGNVYSDEALFDAGIHPATPVSKLGDEELRKIYRSMRRVIDMAIRKRVDAAKFPKRYLLPHREEGEECPRCGGAIRKKKISGRSAYFCDQHQARL